jgi:hypothetical protein
MTMTGIDGQGQRETAGEPDGQREKLMAVDMSLMDCICDAEPRNDVPHSSHDPAFGS